MRHELKHTNPVTVKADKKSLFKKVYDQVDHSFHQKDLSTLPKKEKWRQVRKIVGEYIGNLYKWDPVATYVELDIEWKSESMLEIKLCHDGQEFDQLQGSKSVETIVAGLNALGATPTTFYGTNIYEGFILPVQF